MCSTKNGASAFGPQKKLLRLGSYETPWAWLHVQPGALLLTDAWQGYTGIDGAWLRPGGSCRASTENASELLPRVHRVAALVKRWLFGHPPGWGPARTLPTTTSTSSPSGSTDATHEPAACSSTGSTKPSARRPTRTASLASGRRGQPRSRTWALTQYHKIGLMDLGVHEGRPVRSISGCQPATAKGT